MLPTGSRQHPYGPTRTGPDTGTATRAARSLDPGSRYLTRLVVHLDGPCLALLLARHAHHALPGQTGSADFKLHLPGRQTVCRVQDAGPAILDTDRTERTLAPLEIHHGKAACPVHQNLRRTQTYTVPAAAAVLNEGTLGNGPRRPQDTAATPQIAAQEPGPLWIDRSGRMRHGGSLADRAKATLIYINNTPEKWPPRQLAVEPGFTRPGCPS